MADVRNTCYLNGSSSRRVVTVRLHIVTRITVPELNKNVFSVHYYSQMTVISWNWSSCYYDETSDNGTLISFFSQNSHFMTLLWGHNESRFVTNPPSDITKKSSDYLSQTNSHFSVVYKCQSPESHQMTLL